jgi:hypothetical protein
MLLEKERERLLAVLQSRTASHAERKQARDALEGEPAHEEQRRPSPSAPVGAGAGIRLKPEASERSG